VRLSIPARKSKLIKAFLVFILIYSFSDGLAMSRKGQIGITGSILSGFPSGEFADLTNTGLGVGLELEYAAWPQISLGILVNYLPFQGADQESFLVLSEDWATLSYGAFGKYCFNPEKELVPYFKIGALVTSYDTDVFRPESPASDTDQTLDTSFSGSGKLTATGGVGIRWDISERVGLAGELLFTRFFDVVHDVRGIRREVNTQYVSFNLSAALYLGKRKELPVKQ